MGKWSDDRACWVVHNVRLYSVLDTMVISGYLVYCKVVFGTLAGVIIFSVMWSELLNDVLLWGYSGTLCGCGGSCDCDALTVVCVACVYAKRLWLCEVEGNVGVGDGGGVVVVSARHVGWGRVTRGSGFVSSAADVLGMSMVCGMRVIGGVCEMGMCLARAAYEERGWVNERIGFGLFHSCGNRGSVGRVSVFELWWCMWAVCMRIGPGSRGIGGIMSVWVVSPDYLCRWQVHVSVYSARRTPAHLMCTQCSSMLHLIDICFLPCIC